MNMRPPVHTMLAWVLVSVRAATTTLQGCTARTVCQATTGTALFHWITRISAYVSSYIFKNKPNFIYNIFNMFWNFCCIKESYISVHIKWFDSCWNVAQAYSHVTGQFEFKNNMQVYMWPGFGWLSDTVYASMKISGQHGYKDTYSCFSYCNNWQSQFTTLLLPK